jgi:adhesin/invasin
MANTVIQLKFSTATATPSSLNVAEPAYSYTSNTLFIGTPAGTGSIAIGGKFFLDQQANIFNLVNSAFTAANTAGASGAAYAFNHANAAFDSANSAATLQSGINATQNTNITNAQNTGDAAFIAANSAATLSAATDVTQNNSIEAAFLAGNTAATLQAAINTTQNTNITNAQNTGDAAFTTANNALPTAGGTITGDLVVTGNLTTSGTRTYANTTNVQLGDNIITLNAEIPSGLAPTENAGFEVNRGSAANVSLVWNEANDNWTATNDGSYFYVLADAAVDATQNASITSVTNTATAAFLAANSAATLSAATDATQNTNITNAQNTADAAFLAANSAATLSAATDATQNNSIAAAFTTANNAAVATDVAAINTTQNNSIAAAFSQANTDVTNISISSADFGSATGVASFRVAANGRIVSANTTTIALDASAITSGTLSVARGGTGAGTHTTNGVLLGQGTSALTTASSSTEGHVLTINNSGVPTFSHLQGGTF